ncbi:Eukaryotic translation initiation factor 4E [Lamellibrachia satsuma]|nr:Eukaryotic translation initiation factor 4E [Lamellibrachia satsuma]
MASGQVETKEEQPASAPLKVKAAGDTEDVTANKEICNPELLIKHPLQNKWALWYYKNDKNKDWASNLRLITAFDTVEDFWGLYNHVQPASKLTPGCDYSMFKEGIQPMWEDDRNKKGGRWLINLDKRQRNTELDRFWLETLLCLIGEAFDGVSEYVCGAVVNIRHKGDKLGLWTGDAEKPEATMKIGKILKERLNVPPKLTIGYQAHTDTMVKSGSTAKNRFVV